MSDNLPTKFDADLRQRFLTLYRLTGQLQRAARETGISPTTVRDLKKKDPAFLAAMDEAYEDFKEGLEKELLRRAIMGWEEPVYQQGQLAGTVRKYDARLLELAVKRHIPEYKEKTQVEVTAKPGLLAVPTRESEEDWEKRHAVDADFEEVAKSEEQSDESKS